jgi:MerR family transcriptional regulator, light-induced transcriptional regulator
MKQIYSSKQVAEFLGVNESSVKRWADSGMLGCYKTPGGHRKFKDDDIMLFSRKYSYELKNNAFNAGGYETIPERKFDFKRINSILVKKLFTNSDDEILYYLYSLNIGGLGITELYDNVISGTMNIIGELWIKKEITIEMEHISTSKISKALIRLNGKLESKLRNGLTAFCGCIEKEYHELPLLSVNNVLRYNGWNTIYAGANLPVKSFISGIEVYKPDMVCLSATVIDDGVKFEKDTGKIYEAAKEAGAKFIIGGTVTRNYENLKNRCDALIFSIGGLLNYTREIYSV